MSKEQTPFLMCVDTPDQSRELQTAFATSEGQLTASQYRRDMYEKYVEMVLASAHVVHGPRRATPFLAGLDGFLEDNEGQLLVVVKGDTESISESIERANIPDAMKVTYPPLREAEIAR